MAPAPFPAISLSPTDKVEDASYVKRNLQSSQRTLQVICKGSSIHYCNLCLETSSDAVLEECVRYCSLIVMSIFSLQGRYQACQL
ncbi:unnamed protein product [Acanthoscelides obtectus]|uniref:Uncharacterized protein n=1 Tax=Acanthoscelides obtectus TaxID=200917 RepID=A0A9P0LIU9_ACAOB|nr:unnamed protein product [Acanthoscelides obtectus]CAK1628705.1 hypothetical protein AOBTE_LOCUS5354 [Acanthoscelides obtectus]